MPTLHFESELEERQVEPLLVMGKMKRERQVEKERGRDRQTDSSRDELMISARK